MNRDREEMLNMGYEGPRHHGHLGSDKRAAQFSAFEALSGYEEAIEDTGLRVGREACKDYVFDGDTIYIP